THWQTSESAIHQPEHVPRAHHNVLTSTGDAVNSLKWIRRVDVGVRSCGQVRKAVHHSDQSRGSVAFRPSVIEAPILVHVFRRKAGGEDGLKLIIRHSIG